MEFILKSLKDIRQLAQNLIKKWQKNLGPLVIALYGDLGSGKTTFTQFLAKALKIKEKILSPTFVIIKTFSLPCSQRIVSDFSALIHIDAYRIKTSKELLDLGLKEILANKQNIIVIEWAEKIEKYLPPNVKKIYFEVTSGKERKIIIQSQKSKSKSQKFNSKVKI